MKIKCYSFLLLAMILMLSGLATSDGIADSDNQLHTWDGKQLEWSYGFILTQSKGCPESNTEDYMLTDYLRLPDSKASDTISVRSQVSNDRMDRIVFYDSEFAFLGGDNSRGSLEEYTDVVIPEGSSYFRLISDSQSVQNVSAEIETTSAQMANEEPAFYRVVYKDGLQWVEAEGLNDKGVEVSNANRAHTDYVKLPAKAKRTGYYIAPEPTENYSSIAFYDSEYGFIDSDISNLWFTMKAVRIPENAVFFRLGCLMVGKENTFFEVYIDQEPIPELDRIINGVELYDQGKYQLMLNGSPTGAVNYDLVNSPTKIPSGIPVGFSHWIKFYTEDPAIQLRVYWISLDGKANPIDLLVSPTGCYFTVPTEAHGLVIRMHVNLADGPVTLKNAHCGLLFYDGTGKGFEDLSEARWQ